MQIDTSLTTQSLKAALVAAYVGVLISFWISLVWRIQTGTDVRMCPVGAQDLKDWCTLGELLLAFLLAFIWALFGTPFALVITLPCAIALGLLASPIESRLTSSALPFVQYGLAAGFGITAGLILHVVVGGVIAAFAGTWTFRRARYSKGAYRLP